MVSTLRDNPKPDGYWPGTPSQWREPSVDDCTWYAVEAAFESASEPHFSYHPVNRIRASSTDTEGGTPIIVALRDTLKFWPKIGDVGYTYGGESRRDVERALTSGAAVVVGGDYEKLPLHYRRWTNNDTFDHAMMHKFLYAGKLTYLYDPLGGGPSREPYDGEWISLDALYGPDKFVWQHSPVTYTVGIVENKRETMRLNQVTVEPNMATKALRCKVGTPVYQTPTTIAPIERKIWSNKKLWATIAKGMNGWRLIVWPDSETGNTRWGWISKVDIEEIVDIIPVTEAECSEEEYVKLNAELASYEVVVQELRDSLAQLP